MNTLGSRIAYYRKQAHMTQDDLAKACGWKTQSRVGNYESDVREPNLADIEHLASALKVPMDKLVQRDQTLDPVEQPKRIYTAANFSSIPVNDKLPVITWQMAAKRSPVLEMNHDIIKEWLGSPIKCSTESYVLRVEGESMSNPHDPQSFEDGERIYVDPAKKPKHKSFVIVKNINQNTAYLRQLIIDQNQSFLRVLNPTWPNPIEQLTHEHLIQGVVFFRAQPVPC